jgi:catechol 2,3-dioxygenase-like lactoylglutathione lyase family enzyme
MVARANVILSSIVVFVTDLARSIDFYSEFLGAGPTLRNESAALLVTPDGSQLYLRDIGPKAEHALGAVGPQYPLWSAESRAQLDRCEAFLRSRSDCVTVTEQAGFRLVEGRDPDDEPVVVTYPGPDKLPRLEIIDRIYAW